MKSGISLNAFIFLYRFFAAPLIVLVYLVLVVPLFRKPKQLMGLRLKAARLRAKPNLSAQTVWIHASSGEFEYAKPIIRRIKERAPETFIVVTYSSPSYAGTIQKFPLVDHSEPLPLDLKGPLSSFIQEFKPRCVLLARSDLWPEMLYQLHRRQIPVGLFATSFHQKPSALSKAWKKLNLQMVDLFFLNRQEDRAVLQNWGLDTTKSIYAGDPRFDEAFFRKAHPRLEWQFQFKDPKTTIILGSTWKEDEDAILDSCLEQVQRGRLHLIIAPHEITAAHLQRIQSAASKRQLNSICISQVKASTPSIECPILIVDQVGHLADLYKKANVAFVGGSFRRRVHSVMEPLVCGLPTIVGPYYQNNPEALIFKNLQVAVGLHAVESAASTSEFKGLLERFLVSDQLSSIQQKILQATELQCGASQIIVNELIQRDYIAGEKYG